MARYIPVCCDDSSQRACSKRAWSPVWNMSRGHFSGIAWTAFSFFIWGRVLKLTSGEHWEDISHLRFPAFALKCCFFSPLLCGFVPAWQRVRAATQVQSSGGGSSVLILRVLTVTAESSWQLKEERKIGKWGGVSTLRPLPPHSSLAEDVWIYSGNAAFERNKCEGSSFLLHMWSPSRGVRLRGGVLRRKGVESCTLTCFYLNFFLNQNVTTLWGSNVQVCGWYLNTSEDELSLLFQYF